MQSYETEKRRSLMKGGKALIMAASGCLWLAVLISGQPLISAASDNEVLKATPAQFDAGKILEGKKVEVTATIQNLGKTKVEISNVRTS
jgi:spore coat polysaccharide biosynthesis predicted glycosyltransferase SpsG